MKLMAALIFDAGMEGGGGKGERGRGGKWEALPGRRNRPRCPVE